MRLIDADAFEAELNERLLPELIKRYGRDEALRGLHFSFRDCICNIQTQPTIQPEIINAYEVSDERRIWIAVLTERTAFKYDVFDAPTIKPEQYEEVDSETD